MKVPLTRPATASQYRDQHVRELILDPEEVYSGCHLREYQASFHSGDLNGNKGIFCRTEQYPESARDRALAVRAGLQLKRTSASLDDIEDDSDMAPAGVCMYYKDISD